MLICGWKSLSKLTSKCPVSSSRKDMAMLLWVAPKVWRYNMLIKQCKLSEQLPPSPAVPGEVAPADAAPGVGNLCCHCAYLPARWCEPSQVTYNNKQRVVLCRMCPLRTWDRSRDITTTMTEWRRAGPDSHDSRGALLLCWAGAMDERGHGAIASVDADGRRWRWCGGKKHTYLLCRQVLDDCLYEQRELPLINIFINIFLLFAHFIRLEWAGQTATFQ